MFLSRRQSRLQRRGIVLILILGMLGLLALIGVTFATFSGQARTNARNFRLSQNFPESTELMDYALSQLIDDTYNPQSALRGHSLKRDMYGNDSYNNGFLGSRPDGASLPPNNNAYFYVTAAQSNGPGQLFFKTNIPDGDPDFYGYDFS